MNAARRDRVRGISIPKRDRARLARHDERLSDRENEWANSWVGRAIAHDSPKVVAGWNYDPGDPGGVTFVFTPKGSRWVPFFTARPRVIPPDERS